MADTVKIAALRVAAEIDAIGVSKGAAEIDAATKRAGAAMKSLSDALATVNAGVRPAADGIERLKRTFIDGYAAQQNFERALETISRGLDRGKISAEQADRALMGLHQRYGMTANTAELLARGQNALAASAARVNAVVAQQPNLIRSANDNMAMYRKQQLGLQGTDIVQSLALGMSPLQVGLQQGPQILGTYMGAGGGIKALFADVAGMASAAYAAIGPVGLAIGGVTAAAATYFALSRTEVPSMEQALKAHEEGIKRLTLVWGEAVAAKSKYGNQSSLAATFGAEMNMTDIRTALRAQIPEVLSSITSATNANMDAIGGNQAFRQTDLFALLKKEIDDLKNASADGIPDIIGLTRRLEELAARSTNSGVRALADDATRAIRPVEDLARKAFELQTALDRIKDSVGPNGMLLSQGTIAREDMSNLSAFEQQQEAERLAKLRMPATGAKADPRLAPTSGLGTDLAGERRLAGDAFDLAQRNEIAVLEQRARVIGMNAEAAARSNAIFAAEQQMRQQGLSLLGAEADRRRALAAMTAEYAAQIQRSEQAWQSYQQAGSSAIDALTASTGSLSDRLKGAADALLSWITQLAIANPLKNQLFGTNLPTLADLGKPAVPGMSTTSTATMTVSAGTVMVNGGMMPSLPGANTNGGLLGLIGSTNGVRPTLTPSGIVNSPVTPAAINGVRPDLMAGGIINSPVARTVAAPTGSIEDYIRSSAIQRGIDPDVAVRVAQSEGGLQSWNLQSQYMKNGFQEPSYGPFQLLKGGQGTGFPTGLGNDFVRQTGLDPADAANGPAGVDFALDHASRNGWGAWYGADKAGISRWQGIGTNPGVDNTTTNSISSSMQKFTTSTQNAVKGINTLGDSSQSVGTTLTDSLGKLAAPVAAPPVPAPAVTPTTPTASGGGIFSSLFGGFFKLLGFADGTDFAPGGVALVGERGPELVNLPRGSQVTPNHALQGPNSEERMRGRVVRHSYSIQIAGLGDKELLEKMRKAADESVAMGLRTYNDVVLPGRMHEVSENPYDVG